MGTRCSSLRGLLMLLQESAVIWHCTACTWFAGKALGSLILTPQSSEVLGAAQTEQAPGLSPEL